MSNNPAVTAPAMTEPAEFDIAEVAVRGAIQSRRNAD
jgi:hypothetical protein